MTSAALEMVSTVSAQPVVMNEPQDEVLDWPSIDWRQAEDDVRRLRQRIFTATREGDLKKVRNLQKLMLRSRSNALMSVRRVAELNAGRETAGVDGKTALLASQKADLVDWLQRRSSRWSPKPVKRVYPESRRQATPAGHPRDPGQSAASGRPERVGATVGSPLRAEVLRLPPGPGLP